MANLILFMQWLRELLSRYNLICTHAELSPFMKSVFGEHNDLPDEHNSASTNFSVHESLYEENEVDTVESNWLEWEDDDNDDDIAGATNSMTQSVSSSSLGDSDLYFSDDESDSIISNLVSR